MRAIVAPDSSTDTFLVVLVLIDPGIFFHLVGFFPVHFYLLLIQFGDVLVSLTTPDVWLSTLAQKLPLLIVLPTPVCFLMFLANIGVLDISVHSPHLPVLASNQHIDRVIQPTILWLIFGISLIHVGSSSTEFALVGSLFLFHSLL